MRVAIIGGGLAGCAAAYVLAQRGVTPVIYEASPELAGGASGNEVGLYNPRFTADLNAEGMFYSAAFFKALEVFEALGAANINWKPCGALHVMNDEKKARRFPKTAENWGWDDEEMRIVGAFEASDIAGIEIMQDALYLSRSGIVSPRKLCAAYAHGVEVITDHGVSDIAEINADAYLLAAGMACLSFPQAAHLPLKPVRGQVTYAKATEHSKNLRVTVGFGGYIAPSINGVHCIGSSFQPWLSHSDIIAQDDLDNLAKLRVQVPDLQGISEVTDHRAGVRTTTKDHFPIIGKIAENIYISTAHGSHGILSSLMGAEIIADMITGAPQSVPQAVTEALSPHRFS